MNSKIKLINTICLSGGGIRAFSFIGVLDNLIKNGFISLKKIKNFYGSSSGAIIALLLNLNYSTDEIIKFILKFDFSKISPQINTEELLINYGIDNGDKIIFILKKFIKLKLNMDNITFKQLFEKTKKNLTIIATNLSQKKEEHFNHINTPNVDILLAIRMSFSIPLVFTPVNYKNNYYVDGSVLNDFPIDLCNNDNFIGLVLSPNQYDIKKNIFNYLFSLISSSLSNVTKTKLKCIDTNNIIYIDCNNYPLIDFTMDPKKKNELIKIGINSSKKYMENNLIKSISNILDDMICFLEKK